MRPTYQGAKVSDPTQAAEYLLVTSREPETIELPVEEKRQGLPKRVIFNELFYCKRFLSPAANGERLFFIGIEEDGSTSSPISLPLGTSLLKSYSASISTITTRPESNS